MKEGMPIMVTPKALIAAEQEAAQQPQQDRREPGSGTLAMVT